MSATARIVELMPEAPKPAELPRKLYRPAEVAHMLAISTRGVYRLMQNGELQSVRIKSAVRVRVEDLDQYLADLAADRRAGLRR